MPDRRLPLCVLVSGGLDSAVLVHRLLARGARLLPLYVRCGFVWEAAELFWLRRFLRAERSARLLPLAVVDMPLRPVYGAHWSLTGRRVPSARSADEAVYLPGRNALLLTLAAAAAVRQRIGTIAIGTLSGNPFGDASPQFFSRMARCLSDAFSQSVRIMAPLRRMRKSRLIRSANRAPLHLTFSCLSPRGRMHCGACNKCAERRRAFRAAGVQDPTSYVH
jgi:7-cyano-7-deazaguanine synthase